MYCVKSLHFTYSSLSCYVSEKMERALSPFLASFQVFHLVDLSWKIVDSRRTIQEVLNKSYIRLSTNQATYAFLHESQLRPSFTKAIYAFLRLTQESKLRPFTSFTKYAFLGKRSKTPTVANLYCAQGYEWPSCETARLRTSIC